MKLKNTLLALSAATVIATAGAGVASAETTTAETPAATATAESDSIFGSSSKADDTEGTEGTEGTTSGSSDDFFGWDESTTGAQKFEDVSGIVGKVFGFIGKIVKIFL